MDGVLRVGNKAIPGTSDIIENLISKKIKGALCTNECRYTENQLRTHLSNIDVHIPENWLVYTAGMATRDYLKEKLKKIQSISIGIIGESGLIDTLSELEDYDNFSIYDTPPENTRNSLVLVIGTVNKITIEMLEKGLKWLKAGCKILLTCYDTNDPSSKGDLNLVMPNHILHLLKYNCNIPKPYSVGKPHPINVKYIKKFFKNISPENLLFVGDTISTDIQMAEENGLKSCIVLSGNTTEEALDRYIVEPDYIYNSVKELNENLI